MIFSSRLKVAFWTNQAFPVRYCRFLDLMNNKAMVIFDHTYPKFIDLFISFPEFVEPYKKSKTHLFHMLIFIIQSILASHAQTGCLFLTMPTPNIFGQLLLFENLKQHAKSYLIPSVHSSGKVNFRVPPPHFPYPFLTKPTPKILNYLSICLILYQHAKISQIPVFVLQIR